MVELAILQEQFRIRDEAKYKIKRNGKIIDYCYLIKNG